MQRISDELAGCLDDGGGGGGGAPGPTALLFSPFGKVWRVEVGRDGDGAFLGRGWADFLAAHGVGVGWFVLLRHAGRGARSPSRRSTPASASRSSPLRLQVNMPFHTNLEQRYLRHLFW